MHSWTGNRQSGTGIVLTSGDEIGGYRVVESRGSSNSDIDARGFRMTAGLYGAEDVATGRPALLKVFKREYAGDDPFARRFLREGRQVADFVHANVLSIYDVGLDGRNLYQAMEIVEGETLLDRIQNGGLTAEDTIDLLGPLSEALDAAHDAGLVHGDIRPETIVIDVDEVPRLVSFGVVKPPSGISIAGVQPEGLNYASPEQLAGLKLSGATDVFSLTAVLFHCVSGEVPFSPDPNSGLEEGYVEVPELLSFVPSCPELNDVIARGLSEDPAERQPYCQTLLAEAWDALSVLPPSALQCAPTFVRVEPDDFSQIEPSDFTDREPSDFTEHEVADYGDPEAAGYAEPETAHYAEHEPETADYAEPETAHYAEHEPEAADYAEPETAHYAEHEPETADYAEPEPAEAVAEPEEDPAGFAEHEPEAARFAGPAAAGLAALGAAEFAEDEHERPAEFAEHEPEAAGVTEPPPTEFAQHEPDQFAQHEPDQFAEHEPDQFAEDEHEPADFAALAPAAFVAADLDVDHHHHPSQADAEPVAETLAAPHETVPVAEADEASSHYADHDPEPAPEVRRPARERAPSQTKARGRRRRRLAAVYLIAAGAVLAVALLSGGGGSSKGKAAGQSTTPGATHRLATGGLDVSYRAPWHPASVDVKDSPVAGQSASAPAPIGLAAGAATLVAGTLRQSAAVPGGVPPGLVALDGQPEHSAEPKLDGHQVKRYDWTSAQGRELAVFVLPSARGDLAISCNAPIGDVAALRSCTKLAGAVKVSGVTLLAPGPDQNLAGSLAKDLGPVSAARQRFGAVTGTPLSSRASAAQRLARVDATAASQLARVTPLPRNRRAVDALYVALTAEGSAFSSLGRAAASNQRGTYTAARAAVIAASQRLHAADQSVRGEGFSPPALNALALAPLPAAAVHHSTAVTTAPATTAPATAPVAVTPVTPIRTVAPTTPKITTTSKAPTPTTVVVPTASGTSTTSKKTS